MAPQGVVRTRRVRLASEVEFPVRVGKVCASATDTSCSAWRRTETRAARHEDPYMSPKPSGVAKQEAKQDDAVSASWAEDDHQPGARGISAIQKSAVRCTPVRAAGVRSQGAVVGTPRCFRRSCGVQYSSSATLKIHCVPSMSVEHILDQKRIPSPSQRCGSLVLEFVPCEVFM